MGCPLRATPCCLEFDLSDEEEEGVVVVEEVVAPEDDVLTGRPTFSLRLDLQMQQQSFHLHLWDASGLPSHYDWIYKCKEQGSQ